MTYENFASLYDELMLDVPYDQWVEFVRRQQEAFGVNGSRFLDLACGTGEVSLRLAKEGFQVTGVDLSAEMLTVARDKSEKYGHSLFLVQQDMSEIENLGEFDVVGLFCDSLNYLQSEAAIYQTFERVHHHLTTGGLFIFDVHSLYKINELFLNQTYAYNGEEISYIWQCFEGEIPNSVEHELTFFKLDEYTGQYKRFDELHLQQTFSIDRYKEWLEQIGFEILSITADFTDGPPEEKSERIFFTSRKKES
ncbi:class I SAM-dependent DNA methyltransferase [Niallia sp. Krafla_26]|uniref:class I SAM-dependent DNA methyltransferase n=1 Tax=Niallia sp. Krafla_26 TaxID=3064703 RepID=UPI003D18559E